MKTVIKNSAQALCLASLPQIKNRNSKIKNVQPDPSNGKSGQLTVKILPRIQLSKGFYRFLKLSKSFFQQSTNP
jgi:hypothetical protein